MTGVIDSQGRAGSAKSADRWIAPLGEAALAGFPGAFVETVTPYTESDAAALLAQFLQEAHPQQQIARAADMTHISSLIAEQREHLGNLDDA